jgi:type IV secretion system protein VirD4
MSIFDDTQSYAGTHTECVQQGHKGIERMSAGWKAATSVALLVLALVAGEYLAGWVVIFLLQVPVQLGIGTYWEYAQAIHLPQVAPYVWKIKLAGYAGFGAPLLSWVMLVVLLVKPRASAFHGNARFGGVADARRAGLLKRRPESVIIGKLGRHFLYLSGTEHIIVISPTRAGKTTSLAVPDLLTYEHSVVVMDTKGELHLLTSGQRRAMGQVVYKFAPYAADGDTHRFNPLTYVSTDPRKRISEIQTIGAILYPDDPQKDPFWIAKARGAFLGFASYMYDCWDYRIKQGQKLDPNRDTAFPSFERIYRLSTGDGQGGDLKETIRQWLGTRIIGEQTRTELSGLVGLSEETFSSVIASMQEPLQQFISPILAAATNATDFDVMELRRRRMSIYVVIPPDKLGESGKLLNIFFSTVVGQNLKSTPQDDKTIKNQVLLLMDEFAAMGRVKVLADNISLVAGYWIRLMTIIQSNSQLRSIYGADVAQTISTNHTASIVATPREQQDAEDYSRALGNTTVRRRHRNTGPNGTTYSYTEESRPLMLPQELKELSNNLQIVFLKGSPAFRCKKNWYFKSRFFKKLILPPVEMEPLAQPGEPEKKTVREDGAVVG